MKNTAIAYIRVSTDKQGKSGLGLEAQEQAIAAYAASQGVSVSETFIEVESGKNNHRPELEKALKLAKRTKSTLVIAKLDRLSRNAAFLLTLRDSGVEFVAADNPEANRLTIGILAVIAEHEREMISERTKAALAAAKARGIKLGNPQGFSEEHRNAGPEARRKQAQEFTQRIAHWFQKTAHLSLREAAQVLNDEGVETAKGGLWSASTVRAARARLAA
jgi:DNA invertase Pin-like site-specific DNA recombinase